MAAIEFDVRRWPLVMVTFPPRYSDEEWTAHIEWFRTKLREGRPFACVVDVRGAQLPSANQRHAVAASYAAERTLWKSYIAGAMVVNNAMLRGVITAIQWASPPPFVWRAFTDIEKATAWVMEKIREYALQHGI